MALDCRIFVYDIPESDGRKAFADPSPTLRRVGFRVTLSGWVIPEHLIPYNFINRMVVAGCRTRMYKFDAEEAEKIVADAAVAIRAEALAAVNAVQKTCNESYDPDSDKYDSEEEFDAAKARKVKAAGRRVRTLLNDLRQAGEAFTIDPDALNLDSCLSQIGVIQSVAMARCRVYAKATKRLRDRGQIALAEAAERDRLPPGPMADVLREEGDDEMADEVADAFDLMPDMV